MYRNFFKRYLDIFISILISIFFLPLIIILLVSSLIIFGKSIYTQERIGRNQKKFKIYKITSLHGETENKQEIENNNINNLYGKFIRNFGLDELLQVYNILKGEMSLIGPRPLTPDYIKYYNKIEIKRHEIKPGITGLAQINKNKKLTYKKTFKYDLYYLKNVSLKLDIYIFFNTLKCIFLSLNNKIKITPPFNGKN